MRPSPSWETTAENGQSVLPRATSDQNVSVSSSSSSGSSTSANTSATAMTNSTSSSGSIASSPSDSTTASSSSASPTSTSSSTPTSTSSSTTQPASTTSVSSSSSPPPPPPPSSSSSSSTPSSTSTSSSSSSSSSSSPPPSSFSIIATSSSPTSSGNATVTVFASPNPTNDLGPLSATDSSQGFFSHTGGVAGTFLVIGLFSTSILLCVFFWLRRKIRTRRRVSRRVYGMQDEYKSLSRSLDRQQPPTPEPNNPRPSSRNSLGGSIRRLNNTTPPPPHSSSSNNSLTHIPFPSMDHSPYRAEPGEFDPYKPEAVTKVYSNDYAEASEYQKYLTSSK